MKKVTQSGMADFVALLAVLALLLAGMQVAFDWAIGG